jgi:hypothetical protein
MPTRGAPRVCRGVVLAVISTALAVTAHAVAGGGLPDTGLTVLLLAAVAGVGIALAGARLSVWTILAVLGPTQLVMHLVLSMDMTDMATMDGASLPYNGVAMVLAHVVAVTVTAAMLSHADDAMFFIASVVVRVVPTIVVAPPPAPAASPKSRPAAAPAIRPAAVVRCRANARRGPPVLAWPT